MHYRIIILTGVSGCGKDTLLNMVLNEYQNQLTRIITYTTRPKRETDSDKDIYYFISEKEFKNKIKQGFFFEYEITHGHFYGTSNNSINQNDNLISRMDIRGALNVKKHFPNSLVILINTPLKDISERLIKRGESESKIKIRLQTAVRELKSIKNADIVIDNLDNQIDKAYANLKKAIDNFLSIS